MHPLQKTLRRILEKLQLNCFAAAAAAVASVVSDSVRPHRRQPTRLPVPGILQARTLECVAISFSNAWRWKVKVKSLSRVQLLATPWTAAHQAPPSMGFSRQECWSGVPLYDPAIPLLGIYPKDRKILTWKNMCSPYLLQHYFQ